MANQVELEALLVRVLGDVSDYLKKIKEAQDKTKEATDKLNDKVQSLGHVFATVLPARVERFAGIAAASFESVKSLLSPLEQRFVSTGDVMNKMGDVAQLIPGPWGKAIGTVLKTVGGFTDWLERKLLRAVNNVGNAFQQVASGTENYRNILAGLDSEARRLALSRMTTLLQAQQMGERSEVTQFTNRTALNNPFMLLAQNVPGMQEARRNMEAIEGSGEALRQSMNDIVADMRNQITLQRQIMDRFMSDPNTLRVRVEEATRGLERNMNERVIGLRERQARRLLTSTMAGGETFRGGLTPEQALVRTEVERIARSQNLTAQQLMAQQPELLGQIRRNAQQIVQSGLVNFYGDLAENLTNANREAAYQARTMGMQAREAEVMMQLQRQMRIEERLRLAGINQLGPDQVRQLETSRRVLTEEIELARQRNREMLAGEERLATRQETAAFAAQVDMLRQRQAALTGNFRWVVDTTAQQTQLNTLEMHITSTVQRRLALQRELAPIEARGFLSTRNRENQLRDEINLLQAQETLLRDRLPSAQAALDRARALGLQRMRIEEAVRISTEHQSPWERFRQGAQQLEQLRTMVAPEVYDRRLVQLSQSMLQAQNAQEQLNTAMAQGQAAMTGSAEAAFRVEQFQERMRVRSVTDQANIERTRRDVAAEQGRRAAERARAIEEEIRRQDRLAGRVNASGAIPSVGDLAGQLAQNQAALGALRTPGTNRVPPEMSNAPVVNELRLLRDELRFRAGGAQGFEGFGALGSPLG